MAKKILFESFVTQFLRAASDFTQKQNDDSRQHLEQVIDNLIFTNKGNGKVQITSKIQSDFVLECDTSALKFYTRGDSDDSIEKLKSADLYFSPDKVQEANREAANALVHQLFAQYGQR
jgi:hypothetical protein